MGTTAQKAPIIQKMTILLSSRNGRLAKAILRRNRQCMSNQLINLFKELAQRNACLDARGSQRYRQRIAFI